MSALQIPKRVTAILVYGRPPLVFGGMICAIGVMWTRSAVLYTLGLTLLFISMSFDLVDGWFAARFRPNSQFAGLADRIMDKIVYSIIFPLVSVGSMWRLLFITPIHKTELLHAIFILLLCVTVIIRDHFANFLRSFAIRKGQDPEPNEYTRLRTVVAAPVGALLYAYAFYIPGGPPSQIYSQIQWMANLPLRGLFLIEIIFLVINFGSIAGYCRKYGSYCLDEICLGDVLMRRRILSVFPNTLTVMNAIMGILALFFAYQERVREAYLLLIGAVLFDRLDGALARRLGLTEPLPEDIAPVSRIQIGGIMDDISDAISFCIVPGLIFFIIMSSCQDPFIQRLPLGLISLLYALLGIARLIYFTIDKNPIPGFFKGMPTPAAALMVTAPLLMFSQAVQDASSWVQFWGIFSFGIMILASIVMNIYPVRYLHLGRLMGRSPWFSRSLLLLTAGFALTPYFGLFALLCSSVYLFSPLITGKIPPEIAAKENRFI